MVRPTKERGVVPFRANAIFGWDPGEVGAVVDTTPPVDRVVDAVAEMASPASVAYVQHKTAYIDVGSAKQVVMDNPPAEDNLLVAVLVNRGTGVATPPPGEGWIEVDATWANGGGSSRTMMWYRFAAAAESATVGDWGSGAHSALSVIEFSGGGALDDYIALSDQAPSLTPSIPGLTPAASVAVLVAGFAVDIADFESASFAPGSGFTEVMDGKVSGTQSPQAVAEYRVTSTSGPFTADTTTSLSRDWGGIFAAFTTTDRTWQQAPETQDDNDATYRAFDVSGAFWRTMLTEAFAVGTARAFIGFDSAGPRTVTLEGSEDGTFDDAVTLASATITATGSYTGDELAFTVATPGVYQFYRLVAAGAYDGRVYTVELYDYNPTGVDTTAIEADIDELQDDVAALEAAAGNYELNTEGGQSVIEDDSFPNAGATDDYDPTDGNIFARTLNANHVGTILAPVGSGGATLEWWIDTGAGGFTFELEADGGSVAGDISAHTLAAGQTFRVIAERIPGTTNDWVVDLVGGGGASALTIEDEGTPLATAASTLDFVGAGVTATGAGAEKTITIPGFTLTADALVALGVVGPILIADDHSTPIVFGDLLLTEDGDDFLYADLGG
jgi:hypothetical protein